MRFPRRLNLLAARPDRASLMRFASFRWAALPITNRRWTAPMAAAALGFGIFAGVAIGPGTEGSRGAEGPIMVQLPPPDDAPVTDSGREPGESSAPASAGASQIPDVPAPSGELAPTVPGVGAGSFTTPPYTPPPVASVAPEVTTPQASAGEEAADSEPALTALAGTVVRQNPRAGSYTIADETGALSSIHAIELPEVAETIEVEGRTLANGTYDESSKPKLDGRRKRVSLAGKVTYRDPVANGYTVSGVGSSLFVTVGPETEPPPLGAEVEVDARFVLSPFEAEFVPATPKRKRAEPAIAGCGPSAGRTATPQMTLRQETVDIVNDDDRGDENAGDADDGDDNAGDADEGDDNLSTPLQLEGIVQGVCRNERKLIVSADDIDESGADITLNVPAEIALKKIDAGEAVLATAVVSDAGIYRLTALASDDRAKRAGDAELIQTAPVD